MFFKRMLTLKILSFLLLMGASLFLTSCALFQNIEKPQYEVISSKKNIEIRQYPSLLVAEVTMAGDQDTSLNKGFKQLADYIFGNNIQRKKIRMTAPVMQMKKINPSLQKNTPDTQWIIHFFMPSKYDIHDLPDPKNKNISIKPHN